MENLQNLFSEVSKKKFARTYKPVEVEATKSAPELLPNLKDEDPEPLILDAKANKKALKKEKRKKKRIAEEVTATDTGVSPNSSTISPRVENEPNLSETETKEEFTNKNLDQTVFVGNLPISSTVKGIKKLFSTFGEVISVRLRSVPVAGVKVSQEEAGNQNLVRKICVNTRKFGEQKGSLNSYVVFKDKSSVAIALSLDGTVQNGRHVRVDTCPPSLFDPKRTIFIGGLPYYVDEEELRNFFAEILPGGQNDIAGLRIVRDQETLVGKGIGYLQLKSKDSLFSALSRHDAVFKKRWQLRVTPCGKRTKRNRKETDDSGATKKSPKKQRRNNESVGAGRRIKLKGTVTRKKLLTSRGQKKKK